MSRIFIISDTHFLHEKMLIKYDKTRMARFSNITAIDNFMHDEWNRAITNDDLVIHLGDVAFGSFEQCVASMRGLNGRKILVRGNHDRGNTPMMQMGFFAVFEQVVIKVDGVNILCRHRPWIGPLPDGIYGVFHGHIHTGNKEDLEAAGEESDIPDYNVNCCVEHTNFKPILAPEALGRLRVQLRKAGWWPWYGGPHPLVAP